MFVNPYENSLISIDKTKTITEKKMLCITFVVLILCKGRRDRMVHTTNVASVSPARGKMYSIQHCVIKFVSDLRQVVVFSGCSGFLHQQNWSPRHNWNIVERGVKHHNPNPNVISDIIVRRSTKMYKKY